MGGYGSGRRYWGSVKNVVENCKKIDINQWNREGLIKSGSSFITSWYTGEERVGSISVSVLGNSITLSYQRTTWDEETADVRYNIRLTWRPCNYGGKRPWFLCPGMRCGRRVAKLYLGGKYFLCRHCYNLAYYSQRRDRSYRLMDKSHKINKKIGGSLCGIDSFPPKPKGMHWKTYIRLKEEDIKADRLSLWEMAMKLGIFGDLSRSNIEIG